MTGGVTHSLVAAGSLAWREWVRFFRQPNRVIGAVATPIVFWLLIGAGVGRSFSGMAAATGGGGGGQGAYLTYFYPGTILMVILFTAIFSTISVIEDRREGFMQGVLVAPVGRWAIVGGKVLGGAGLAFVQGSLLLALAPLVGISLAPAAIAWALVLIGLLSVGLTALGLVFAWRMTSTQGFHAVMNLVMMPMWFLSGALFPVAGAWRPLAWVMYANPLTWGLAGLRGTLGGAGPGWLSIAVTTAFTFVLFSITVAVASRPARADLQ